MATKKGIEMTARATSTLSYDDYLYLTGESPNIDEKMQASVLRDYVLSGVKTSANSGLAQTSTPYAGANPEYELTLDANNLDIATGTIGLTDYIVIEAVGSGLTKKMTAANVLAAATGAVTSVTGGTNLTASPTTGLAVVNLDATLTGLTSVTSTDFVGALAGNVTGNVTGNLTGNVTGNVTGDVTGDLTGDVTGDVTGALTGNVTGNVTGDVTGDLTGNVTGDVTGDLTGTASTATALAATLGVTGGGTGIATIAKGSVLVANAADTLSVASGVTNGHVLTYDSAADTVGWAAPGHATGTVTSVAITGTDGIDVDSGSPITTSGTITLGLSGIGDAAISSAATWNAKQNALTFGIADTNSVVIDSASVADNDYAKFTASGLEGRTASETKTDLSLDNVENTALSTWAGTTNITTLGTIASGTWEGTTVALDQGGTGMTSIAKGSVLVANAADTLSAASGVTDGHVLTYTSASDTVGWAAPAASGDPAGTAVAMAIALGG